MVKWVPAKVYWNRILSRETTGMFAKLRIVLEREVETIVSTAAFLAGQCRTCDEKSGLQYVRCFMRATIAGDRHLTVHRG